mmetsp:Transcript_21809/g.48910  ORF Transcript_21809/g.48910 Transcript_21809/m.48910 type:complete len:135 (-) Transcript_21809:107-511(-)
MQRHPSEGRGLAPFPLLGISEELEDLAANQRDGPQQHRRAENTGDVSYPPRHVLVTNRKPDAARALRALPLHAIKDNRPTNTHRHHQRVDERQQNNVQIEGSGRGSFFGFADERETDGHHHNQRECEGHNTHNH